VALLLLAAVDAWLLTVHPLAGASTIALDRSEGFSAMRVLESGPASPDVILLGSSLVTAPVMQAEATALNRQLPRLSYRRSSVLEQYLAARLDYSPTVFCLASGGQMASDAYYMARHAIEAGKRPAAFVYGVGLRDFQDNLVPTIDSTEPFQCFAAVQDLPQLLTAQNIPARLKLNMAVGRLWALWRYRTDLRLYLTAQIKGGLEALCPFTVFERFDRAGRLRPSRQGKLPEEVVEDLTAAPGKELEHFSRLEVMGSYRRRYNPFSPTQFETQFQYLERLLQLCRDDGIELVAVNMPVSRDGQELMPRGLYATYLHSLQSLCARYDAGFINLNTGGWGDNANYIDGVHLTAPVSNRFLKELADRLSRSPLSTAVRKQRIAQE